MNEIALTTDEQADLAQLESVIERGMNTFIEVGNALAAIQEQKLYRASHGTFEDYCRNRWNMGRAHAYRMITAAEAVSPMGDTGLPVPTNERQARELGRIPEAERADVWRATVERTGGQPTAAAVRETYAARADEVVDAELVDEPSARTYAPPPVVQRAVTRPRVDVPRTVLVALSELRQVRDAFQGLTPEQLARQDEETRRIWAARLTDDLEALHGFLDSLTKENNQ